MKPLVILFLLLPFACFAQLKLEGRVIDVTTGSPIPDASVFLTNTTIGTKSNQEGIFTLINLRNGQYDLVVTVVGYEAYRKTIMVNATLQLPDIKMLAKTTMMNDIRIVGSDPNRARKLRLFKKQFLGQSETARQCEILNPEILDLRFTKGEELLLGSTDDFLEIDNNALGYKLKYLVSSFTLNEKDGQVAYEGAVLFEEKDGSPSQKKRWENNRLKIYRGSATHFLRDVLANQADQNFLVRRFCFDSVDYNRPNFLVFDTLRVVNYIHRTDQLGVFAMSYPSPIDIYLYPSATRARRLGANLVVTINFIEPNMFFDGNGTILNPMSVLLRNSWGYSRVGELLPIDYWPEVGEIPTVWVPPAEYNKKRIRGFNTGRL